jgi:hypothetical protein
MRKGANNAEILKNPGFFAFVRVFCVVKFVSMPEFLNGPQEKAAEFQRATARVYCPFLCKWISDPFLKKRTSSISRFII